MHWLAPCKRRLPFGSPAAGRRGVFKAKAPTFTSVVRWTRSRAVGCPSSARSFPDLFNPTQPRPSFLGRTFLCASSSIFTFFLISIVLLHSTSLHLSIPSCPSSDDPVTSRSTAGPFILLYVSAAAGRVLLNQTNSASSKIYRYRHWEIAPPPRAPPNTHAF